MARKRPGSERSAPKGRRRRSDGPQAGSKGPELVVVEARNGPGRAPKRSTRLDRERLRAEFASWCESAPSVRPDKVIEAKLRISRGEYDREEVLVKAMRSLLRELLPGSRSSRSTRRAKRERKSAGHRRANRSSTRPPR